MSKKSGEMLEQITDLRGTPGKKEAGGVIEGGGVIPKCTLCTHTHTHTHTHRYVPSLL